MTNAEFLLQFRLAAQLDRLFASLTQLADQVKDGETDLLLKQPKKSRQQKLLYLKKLVEPLPSPELVQWLDETLAADNLDFFGASSLGPWVTQLQRDSEALEVLEMTFAITFKPKEIGEVVALCAKKIGRQVVLNVTVEPGLIGGALVRYGDHLFDYSVRSRLERFRASWKEAVVAGPKQA
jgi:F-type H+-transporting ATPase subunit delta